MSGVPSDLEKNIKPSLLPLFTQRDGGVLLAAELPKVYLPEKISTNTDEQRVWELSGLFFFHEKRYHEALSIFTSLYYQMLKAQLDKTKWVHKGMPLLWMSECYMGMGFPVLSKRYLMLAFCEDAIRGHGFVSPENTGVYFRLVWRNGLPDSELKRYAKEVYDLRNNNLSDSLFPEFMLQKLTHEWMIEFPAPEESVFYLSNQHYIRYLVSKLGEPTGTKLEQLAEYLLSCMPGCRTSRRLSSESTDYDVVCSMDGSQSQS